jgi:hypothetical protein
MRPEFLAIGEGRDTRDEITRYHHFRAQFAAMLDQRFYTVEWLDHQIYSGAARLWSDGSSAIIATLKTYPTGAIEVHGLIAVGALETILELIELAEDWGKRCGAIVACIESRSGWAKPLAQFGYEPHQLTLRKEL